MGFISFKAGGIFTLVIFGAAMFGIYKLDKKFTTSSVELYKREKIKAMARKDVMNMGKGSAFSNLTKIVSDANKRKPKKPEGESLW